MTLIPRAKFAAKGLTPLGIGFRFGKENYGQGKLAYQ